MNSSFSAICSSRTAAQPYLRRDVSNPAQHRAPRPVIVGLSEIDFKKERIMRKRLSIRKVTLRDLDPQLTALDGINGGVLPPPTNIVICTPTKSCLTETCACATSSTCAGYTCNACTLGC